VTRKMPGLVWSLYVTKTSTNVGVNRYYRFNSWFPHKCLYNDK